MVPTIVILGPCPATLHVVQEAGWAIQVQPSFVQAEVVLQRWHGRDETTPRDRLIVFGSHQDAQGLPSWLFAADLRLAMATGVLPPTPLVVLDDGIADAPARRRYELAGCTILPAPATPHDLLRWNALMAVHAHAPGDPSSWCDAPPRHARPEQDALVFCQAASTAYAALRERYRPVAWTAEEVRSLLGFLRCPSPRSRRDQRLLNCLGGYGPAKAVVQRWAALLPDPSYTAIIIGMLERKSQERIAAEVYRTREWVCRQLPVLCDMLADVINHHARGHSPGLAQLSIAPVG